MLRELLPSVRALIVLSLLTGLFYPLAVTGLARLAFPHQAGGSLVRIGDTLRGSALIGQAFDDPRYFFGRLSATAPPCNGGASSGSNLGPLHPAVSEAVAARLAALALPSAALHPPVDLVTASGSGLDPHISPAAARFQVTRVARERGLDQSAVRGLIDRFVEGRTLGILGEPRVNVLQLNLALDALR